MGSLSDNMMIGAGLAGVSTVSARIQVARLGSRVVAADNRLEAAGRIGEQIALGRRGAGFENALNRQTAALASLEKMHGRAITIANVTGIAAALLIVGAVATADS